jgi:Rieske Fe-S protein
LPDATNTQRFTTVTIESDAHESTPEPAANPCEACSSRRAFFADLVALGASAFAAAAAVGLVSPVWSPLHALPDEAPAHGAARVARYPVPAGDSVSIDKQQEVILCRKGAEVFAFALSCPHQNTALRSLPRNTGFQCPRHKSKYAADGTFQSGKATRNMDRLPITLEGAQIVVDPATLIKSDTDPAKWAAALVRV